MPGPDKCWDSTADFFSTVFVRCQAACLVSRMGYLGEGARRRVWHIEEERTQREQEAFHSAYIRVSGRALVRPGH